MSGIDDLRGQLADAYARLDDACAHAARARELLGQAREVLAAAQALHQPWLPAQFGDALGELDAHTARLSGVRELLEAYGARL